MLQKLNTLQERNEITETAETTNSTKTTNTGSPRDALERLTVLAEKMLYKQK